MTEEIEKVENEQNVNDYVEAINKLKASTVSKDDYNRLKEENKTLLDSLVNGASMEQASAEPVEKIPLNQLRKELFTPEHTLSDLEYARKALELRSRVLEETGKDCFIGSSSSSYTPDESDFQKAQAVASLLETCIEKSDGNNAKFIAELQTHLNDVRLPRLKK